MGEVDIEAINAIKDEDRGGDAESHDDHDHNWTKMKINAIAHSTSEESNIIIAAVIILMKQVEHTMSH